MAARWPNDFRSTRGSSKPSRSYGTGQVSERKVEARGSPVRERRRATMSLIGPEGRKQLQLAARFATAGLELSIAIVVGYFGGRAIDGWLETTPYGAYIGLILGIIAGFRNLFLLAKSASKQASSQSVDSAPDPAHSSATDSANPHEKDPGSPHDAP